MSTTKITFEREKPPKKPRELNRRKYTPTELKTMAFVATIMLAGLATILDVDSTGLFAFLGTALGYLMGRADSQ